MRAIGLMSGTSLDGIDVALIDTDGLDQVEAGPSACFPYSDDDRALLRGALAAAETLDDRHARPGLLGTAEHMITTRHIAAVREFLALHRVDPRSIQVIGFHGQTVLHRPGRRLTVQIGDGGVLADRLGVPVVADMRAADVAAGGQGAPLVPVFHRALVNGAGLPGSTLVINIGGVANITLVRDNDDPLAWDTGPGNALLDDLMLERTGTAVDRDGAAAAAGRVDAAVLARMLAHPFFERRPPKSLDRNDFTRDPVKPLATPDAAATLTAFTAGAIARSLEHLDAPPDQAIVCGGGARNPTLIGALRTRLPCPVTTAGDHGWDGDAIEAQAFAYLAARSLNGLALTFPGTTGVERPLPGGVLFRPGGTSDGRMSSD